MDIGPKTLFYFNRFLYIIFMNKTIITFITLFLTALPCFAQGKLVKDAIKATTRRAPKPIRVKTYVPTTGAYRNISVEVPTSVNKKMLQSIDNISERVTLVNLGTAYAPSYPLDFLNATYKRTPLVEAETRNAHNLIHRVHRAYTSKGFLDKKTSEELKAAVEETVVNKSLKSFLLRSLEEQNFTMFITDLAEYYTLPKNYIVSQNIAHLQHLNMKDAFVESASNYLLRHPHKTNFKLRLFLSHPAVSEQLKNNIQHFLQIPVIPAEEVAYLKTLLGEIYTQNARTISLSKSSPQIQKAYASHVAMRMELEAFIKENGRMPKFNTLSLEERNLKTNIDFLLNHAQLNPIYVPEIVAEVDAIKALAQKYAIKYSSKEVVKQKFEQFVKETGRVWPRGLEPQTSSSNLNAGPISAEESLLHEELLHHISYDSQFHAEIHEIARRYQTK